MSWIPSLIGIQNTLFELPYRFFRGFASKAAPTIDYAKYLTPETTTKETTSTQALREKYQVCGFETSSTASTLFLALRIINYELS